MGQLIAERGRFLCVSIKGNNSHVKAQILLLLEEIVQDVLSHKVWVQGVVDYFSSPKLHKKRERTTTSWEWKSWHTDKSTSLFSPLTALFLWLCSLRKTRTARSDFLRGEVSLLLMNNRNPCSESVMRTYVWHIRVCECLHANEVINIQEYSWVLSSCLGRHFNDNLFIHQNKCSTVNNCDFHVNVQITLWLQLSMLYLNYCATVNIDISIHSLCNILWKCKRPSIH